MDRPIITGAIVLFLTVIVGSLVSLGREDQQKVVDCLAAGSSRQECELTVYGR